MSIARWTADRDSPLHQPLTRFVYVFDVVGEVTEVSSAPKRFGFPIVSQFHLGLFVSWSGKEDERESSSGIVYSSKFAQTQ